MIRAVAHLTGVSVEDADRLYHRHKPLGVYSREDVRGAADGRGHAMAMRFSHTQTFEQPVPLSEYRRILTAQGSPVVLRSVRPVSEHVFVTLIDLGFPHAC